MLVRLESISITNFKNVKKGQLSFTNNRKSFKTSILGLYGQNGSGKTALIDAIALLQIALRGQQIPQYFAEFINVEAEYSILQYEFDVYNELQKYRAFYEFKLKAEKIENSQNIDDSITEESHFRAAIYDEILSYSFEDSSSIIRKSSLIDTTSSKVFGPVAKYNTLVGKDKDLAIKLMVDKNVSYEKSKSFVFSRKLLNSIRNKNNVQDTEYLRHIILLESLVRYGNFELFVINSRNSDIISMNLLPLSFVFNLGTNSAAGNILIPLEEAKTIPEEAVAVLEKLIANMNIVLSQIVPGLTIRIEKLGEMLFANGKKGVKVQLMSLKNSKDIPLKYESDGIFEYLLGELLRVISEKGNGQLLFTSHNLRPLETIDRGFIAFTTKNPEHRYIRMTNLKDNNNLRDFYYRDIILGEQSEEVYDPTNNAEIAFAFRQAGNFNDS